MRTMIAALLLSTAAIAPAANAETLDESMSAALETNPSLAAARARLNATREQLPQAWSEALPQISASASASESSFRSDNPAVAGGEDRDWSGGISASQLLFGSGRVLATTRQARATIAQAAANYESTEQTLLLDVTRAYADVRQAQAVVAAREQTVRNLSSLFNFSTAQFDAGVVTRTDVAQSQARSAQARTQLVQAQGQLAAAVETYMRLVGYPPSDLEAPGRSSDLPQTLDAALDVAGRENPTLLSAVAAQEAADAAVLGAYSNFGPRVTLEGSTGRGGGFDDGDFDSRSDSVGVRLSVPLFTGGSNVSRARQQRALRSAANLDVAAAQRSVRESVTTAWTTLQSAQAAVISAREQVEAAELAYRGVRLEQETGLRSTVEVLDQEQDLLTARLALAQSERDLVVAERQVLALLNALRPQATADQDE
ncbi:MAG: TolC family outer membrane protein [Alphaproteobacteria bacterium]|nr:TolC family outer membrane protein [Alphaproteobacteria bacterium]